MNPKLFFELPVQQTPSFKSPLTKTPRPPDSFLLAFYSEIKTDT